MLVRSGLLLGQDPVFSQFYNSPVYLNPALIGEEEHMMFNLAHRSQWKSLNHPYTTTQASLIIPYYQEKHLKPEGHIGAVGVSFFGDKAGVYSNFKSYGGNVSFAYNVPLSTKNVNRFTFALQPGFIRKKVDKENLTWGEQYNPFIGFDNTVIPQDLDKIDSRTFLDITAGVFWRYISSVEDRVIHSIYAGFVAAHLNHPDESVLSDQENRLPVLYKLHGGIIFRVNPQSYFSLNYLSQLQDLVNQTNLGVFYSRLLPFNTGGKLSNLVARIGAWHRVQDSFIGSIGFATDHLQFGFSYDWNVTSLRYNNRGTGSYEITMAYRFFEPAPPKVRY
jgi:type IX secretion system PorP/SprF family membrane protein